MSLTPADTNAPERLTGRRVEAPSDPAAPPIITQTHSSGDEVERRRRFHTTFRNSPIPEGEQLANVGLYLNRQTLSRLLFLEEMYRRIIDVHGIVVEFGVRWGRDLVAFSTFRGMYEPYNYLRKIVGFDTFEGFGVVHTKDRTGLARTGDYGVTPGYEQYLEEVLDYHEAESPIGHVCKYELVKGDASVTVHEYLERHPETIVALAYFDMDVYRPTKVCLEAIKPHLTRGSVVGFDEACYPEYPGETIALREVFDLSRCRLHRSPNAPSPSYFVLE